MRLRILLVLAPALAAVALAGCGQAEESDFEADEVPVLPAPATPAPDDEEPEVTAGFRSMGDHEVTGRLRVFGGDDEGFRLDVALEGLPEGEYAWHIHQGSCDDPGPVAVPLSASGDSDGIAGPLLVSADSGPARGAARVRRLSLDEAISGDYTLHVREGGQLAEGRTLACAPLSRGAEPADTAEPAEPTG